jgi:glycerophosphoryl diester phosphodiesterase
VDVRTALLGPPGLPLAVLLRRAKMDGHDEAHAHVSSLLAQPDRIEGAVREGLCVTGWTVNRSDELRTLAAAGLSAVITDDPQQARLALRPQLVPA